MRISFKSTLKIVVSAAAGIYVFAIMHGAFARMQFPVAELGNCANAKDCKAFCDKQENMLACTDFAEKNGLVSKEQADKTRAFAAAADKGPGGCTTPAACQSYCDNPDHVAACIEWADQYHLMSQDELREARKVIQALKNSTYLPGGCTTKQSCEAYCQDIDHLDACMDFAEKSGFMTREEAALARKMLSLIKEGKTPGGCTTKDACRSYCSTPDHRDECLNFARQYSVLPEDAQEQTREGIAKIQTALQDAPPEIVSCIAQGVGGRATLNAILSGTSAPTSPIGQVIQQCFTDLMPKIIMQRAIQGTEDSFRPTESPAAATSTPVIKGPGGCASPESCMRYCMDPIHIAECVSFVNQQPEDMRINTEYVPLPDATPATSSKEINVP